MLEQVNPASLALPASLDTQSVVRLEWDLPPRELDGVFVGQRMNDNGWLEFYAVDESGTILWVAERPPSCTGFALSRTSEGHALVILTNLVSTSEAIAIPTAQAFDLFTGERVWGPTEVTGPHKGPGLVFAAAPEGFMGDTGKKIALDAATGDVIAAENQQSDARIVGEFQGVLLKVHHDMLTAERRRVTGNLDHLWSIPLTAFNGSPDQIANRARQIDLGERYVLIPGDKQTVHALDLATGAVIAQDAHHIVYDKQSKTLVILDDIGLRGVSEDGTQWSAPILEGASLLGIGTGLAYVRHQGSNIAFSLADGHSTLAEFTTPGNYDAPIFLPVQTTARGATLVEHGGTSYLVTIP